MQMTPFFFPALFNLRLARQLRAGLCGGFRLDPPWAVIRGVLVEHLDLFITARHMNPYFVRRLNHHCGSTGRKTYDSLSKLVLGTASSLPIVRHFAAFVVCWL